MYFENCFFFLISLLKLLKTESIYAGRTIEADCLGEDFKISKKISRMKQNDLVEQYEASGTSVLSWNYNGPMIVISIVHLDLPRNTAKRWSLTDWSNI